MAKMKVLAIAPYSGLNELIKKTALRYDDRMEVTSLVGDLHEGLEIAKSAEKEGYDIIISRGGTSEMIMKEVSIPVVNIDVSGYDYMRAIKLAGSIPGLHAVVGFSGIIENAGSVNELLQTNMQMFTVQSQDEITPLLRRLNSEGYGLIIGDVATERRARDLGMNSLLLTSGEESVNTAFVNALSLYNEIEKRRKTDKMFQKLIEADIAGIAVFSDDKKLLYSNFEFNEQDFTISDLMKYFDSTVYSGSQDIILQKGTKLIKTRGKVLSIDKVQKVVAFYFSLDGAMAKETSPGISFSNVRFRSESLFDLFRKNDIFDKKTISMADSFSKTALPVLITGAAGVGKSYIAYGIHRCSESSSKPYVTVDCELAKPESWEKLLLGTANCAPLTDGATVCFKNLDKMPMEWQDRLAALLQDSGIAGRYRYIATAASGMGKSSGTDTLSQKLHIFFSQLMLNLPEINQRICDIRNPVNMFIIESNARCGKQVTGIEDEALELLRKHPWKYNFRELKQVVSQLVISSAGPYISAGDVCAVFEARGGIPSVKPETLDLSSTLDDIEIKVIKQILDLENGNYSNTARRLGIGRSTLWRKLNKRQKQD